MPADGITAPSRVESTAFALQTEAAEHERQFRETLEHCPAGLVVVDEDGRLIFHNARLREMLGYNKEMELIDTRTFWHDLDHRSRIVETLRDRGGIPRDFGYVVGREPVMREKNGFHSVQAVNGSHVAIAKVSSRARKRLEDGLEIEC
jgi:PAS domain S-box-containing protein